MWPLAEGGFPRDRIFLLDFFFLRNHFILLIDQSVSADLAGDSLRHRHPSGSSGTVSTLSIVSAPAIASNMENRSPPGAADPALVDDFHGGGIEMDRVGSWSWQQQV